MAARPSIADASSELLTFPVVQISGLRTIVSERSDQALSWCKSQVDMFEGDLMVSISLARIMKRTQSENEAHGRIVRQPVPSILGHLLVLPPVATLFPSRNRAQKLVQHIVFL